MASNRVFGGAPEPPPRKAIEDEARRTALAAKLAQSPELAREADRFLKAVFASSPSLEVAKLVAGLLIDFGIPRHMKE